jgi:hypothetical protein
MATHADSIKLRGDIEIKVRRKSDNQVIQVVEVRNKIVNAGLFELAKLLVPSATGKPLGSLRVGVGSTHPATAADTVLQSPVTGGSVTLRVQDVTVTKTGAGATQVAVQATIPTLATNLALSEAGLFLSDSTLFARQIHLPILTEDGLAFDYYWTLTFTA